MSDKDSKYRFFPGHFISNGASDQKPEEESENIANESQNAKANKVKIYRSTSEELKNTLENQIEAYRELNQRAADLVKINLIGLSVVFTGISIGRFPINIPTVSGFLSLSYGVWSCFRIYTPTPIHRGLGPDDINNIDDMAIEEPDKANHFRRLMFGFKDSVGDLDKTLEDQSNKMRNAIWATILSILFFIVAIIKNIFSSYPSGADLVWIIVLPILVLWAKYKYKNDNNSL